MSTKSLIAVLLLAASAFAQAEDITVSAAASLKEAFTDIARQYEKQHPDAKIKLNTAASGTLLQQLAQGAPVDVLATADLATMDKAAAQNLIRPQTRKTFALNSLVLITPKQGSLKIATPKDLLRSGVKRIAVGNPASVPAGAYTQAALEKQKLWSSLQPKIVHTQNVRQALDYVIRSETEAGFVYRTDAALKPHAVNIVASIPTEKPVAYPIALTQSSKASNEAQRFVNYVLSADGQRVLQRYGFSAAK